MPLEAKFVVIGGDTKSTEVKLRLPTIIGRGRSSGIMVHHALVSRQHCEVYEANGRLMVRDLGSLNGTFVGQERITDCELLPEQLLTVGNVTFRAVYELGPEAAGLLNEPTMQSTPPDGVVISTQPVAAPGNKTVPVPTKAHASPAPKSTPPLKVAPAAKAAPSAKPAPAKPAPPKPVPAPVAELSDGNIEIDQTEESGDEDSSADFAAFLKSLEGGNK